MLHTFFQDFIHLISTTFSGNAFAQGGLMLGILGAVAAYLRNLPGEMIQRLKNRLTLTVEVQGDDAAYTWLTAWLAAQPQGKRLRHLGIVTRYNEQLGGHNLPVGTDADGDEITVRLIPLSGQTLLRYRGHWLLARPSREKQSGQDQRLLGYTQTLTLRLFSASRQILPELLREAYTATAGANSGKLEIHIPQYNDWQVAERRKVRPLSSLVYAADLLENVLADVLEFGTDQAWYAEMGIPYRRGYLLHGPPGNGKSSLVAALAGAAGLNICVLNLATPDLSDDRLSALLSSLPNRALLLLEDIDAVFKGREPRSPSVKLSFNGLLNALDGVAAGEGRLTFMTTNHLGDLDPALIRPGRADRHIQISNASTTQIAGMLRRFFPELEEARASALAQRIPEQTLSMARVQEYLLERRGNLSAAESDWAELCGTQLSAAKDQPCPTRLRLQSA
ncbi:AAA family ATPase [Deinococcus detaillensis]|uniref:AAA family ATPase n=1 Tax=Deinococcus detaillensis TaxID=2592048 RepID=A0A553UQP6_9DEIO|nr:AAA family ATPase [Deinococcus detaillensis]TSA82534.1 AAA family ATPase [Deinococcus detaillensis]